MVRCPFLESDFLMHNFQKNMSAPGSFLHNSFVQAHPDRNPEDGIFLQLAELADEPRIIKTHLPFSLLPKHLPDTSKVVYVARNSKDVAVSYCHHSRLLKCHDFCGTTSEFVDHFVNDTLVYSPFWTHIKEGWKRRNQSNIHFMFYEDLKANPKAEIARLKDFLNVDLTNDQIEKIVHYTSFDQMKEREGKDLMGEDTNEYANSEVEDKDGGFFRKGQVGDYKNKLSEEDIERINKWTKENTRDMESEFKYKIN
ncbi:Sulfotransferase family cytosolic 1B member 1 [Armadillidium nasatum]|uniref:Sulfotransferase family cytosolic 1B member 1 n=1 Tax=Armadillidium nasatum TaxID=96803 RepID=A0A5N5TCI9_9CRUS|nr:Sulfotransferase family cytosolic 1B member 1 [Armadillidium nasatum]